MRRVLLVLLVPLLSVLTAQAAAAHDVSEHDGSKIVGSDLRSRVVSSDLPAGMRLEVRGNGESLRLRNDSADPVTVLRGAGSERLTVDPGGAASWHEDAAHPNGADVDEDRPVQTWRVALRIGATSHVVDGEIRWSEGPNPIGWILLAVGIGLALTAFAWRTRRDLLAIAVPLTGAIGASLVHTVAAFTARAPADGRWDVAGDYLPVVGCWLLGGLAVGLLLRGTRDGAWLAALAATGLVLVTASGDAAVLWSSTLVVDLPDDLDRAVVALLLGLLGAALVAVPVALRRGGVASRDSREGGPPIA